MLRKKHKTTLMGATETLAFPYLKKADKSGIAVVDVKLEGDGGWSIGKCERS